MSWWRLYIDSWKTIGRNIFYTMSADLLQYLLLMGIIIATANIFYSLYVPLEPIFPAQQNVSAYYMQYGKLPQLTDEMRQMMQEHTGLIQAFYAKLSLLIVVSLLLILLLSGIARCLAYNRMHGTKLKRSYFKTFMKVNTAWLILSAMVLIASSVVLKMSFAAYVLAVLAVMFWHFSAILRYSMKDRDTVTMAFQRTFDHGLLSGNKFIVPLMICLLTFLAIGVLTFLDRLLPQRYVVFIIFVALFVYFSWARNYYLLVMEERT
jgi:hypothetical protein